MKVGFTGTQQGMSSEQRATVAEILNSLGHISVAIHGACIGADYDFNQICSEMDIPIEAYPSTIKGKTAECVGAWLHPPMPPLDRNRAIVERADIILACPAQYEEILRSGTWATVRYARKANVKLIIIYPNGVTRNE